MECRIFQKLVLNDEIKKKSQTALEIKLLALWMFILIYPIQWSQKYRYNVQYHVFTLNRGGYKPKYKIMLYRMDTLFHF